MRRPTAYFDLADHPAPVSDLRHWHKYVAGHLPREQRFYFDHGAGLPIGVAAGNLLEFDREINRCGGDVVRHDAAGHDFSRWLRDVLADESLAREFEAIETQLVATPDNCASTKDARAALLGAIEAHYLE